MDTFPLIKSLQHPDENSTSPSKLHNYTEVDVIVEGQQHKIFVPAREYNNIIAENLGDLSQHEFKMILRKYRGVRG